MYVNKIPEESHKQKASHNTIKISSTVITPITLENLITPQRLD